jgi:hypothetical protein
MPQLEGSSDPKTAGAVKTMMQFTQTGACLLKKQLRFVNG